MPDLDFLVATGTRRPSQRVTDAAKWFADKYGGPAVMLVVGDATGFDAAMEQQWERHNWPIWRIAAPWDTFRKAWGEDKAKLAGPARNAAMAGAAKRLRMRGLRGKGVAAPDAKSSGTLDCLRELEDAGLSVEVRNV